jgi:hypothetical protein
MKKYKLREELIYSLKNSKYSNIYDTNRMFLATEHKELFNTLVDGEDTNLITKKFFLIIKFLSNIILSFRYIGKNNNLNISNTYDYLIYYANFKASKESKSLQKYIKNILNKNSILVSDKYTSLEYDNIKNLYSITFLEYLKILNQAILNLNFFWKFKFKDNTYSRIDKMLIKIILYKNYLIVSIIRTSLCSMYKVNKNSSLKLLNLYSGTVIGDSLNKIFLENNLDTYTYLTGSSLLGYELKFYRQKYLLIKNKEEKENPSLNYERIYEVGNISIGISKRRHTKDYDFIFYDTCTTSYFSEKDKQIFYTYFFKKIKKSNYTYAVKFHPASTNKDIYKNIIMKYLGKGDFIEGDFAGEELLHNTSNVIIVNSTLIYESVHLRNNIISLAPLFYSFSNRISDISNYHYKIPGQNISTFDEVSSIDFSKKIDTNRFALFLDEYFYNVGSDAYKEIVNVLKDNS